MDPSTQYDFSTRQRSHAPRAARCAYELNLCADSGAGDCICDMYGDCICDMYDGHTEDTIHTYRNKHHCECGRTW